MRSKDQTFEFMNEAMRVIQAQFSGPGQFQKVRCDKGGEFESQKFREISTKYGAESEYAETAVHEHNATAERVIRTIKDHLRALLFESGFPSTLWG